MAKTTVDLPEVLHRKLRVKAAVESRSMNDIIVAAVKGYLDSFRIGPELLEPELLAVETIPRSGHSDKDIVKEG
jgi:plasmid stability protein